MREPIIYSTKNCNSYLYDTQHMLPMLTHPELRKVYEKKTDVDPYYLRKYEYLKKYAFSRPEPVEFDITISEDEIEKNLKQLKEVVFETTDYCNLKCPYCSLGPLYEGFNKSDPQNINLQHAKRLLEYIFQIKSPNTKLTIGFFGGEPLINIEFIKKIVQFIEDLNIEKQLAIKFNMVTNATLLDKHIAFLVENDFSLLISLDGNEYGHGYRTFAKNNKNSFKEIITNLDIIQRDYPEYFINKISFNSVLHARNSVKEIYEFIYNRYNKLPRIAQLNTEFINPDKRELHRKMFHSKRESEEELLNDKSVKIPIEPDSFMLYSELESFLQYDSINFYASNLLQLFQQKIKTAPSNTCIPFAKNIFLNTHSYLYPCENIKNEYFLGKIDKEGIVIDIPEIVRKYKYYFEHIKKLCQDCYSARSCDVCMYSLINLEKLPKENIKCLKFQDKETYVKKLHHIFSFIEKHPDYIKRII